MFRKTMAANAGMLFDFHTTVMTTFWMKNTILPLDIIFVRSDGTISSIAGNAVPFSEAPIPSSEPIRAVLEIKRRPGPGAGASSRATRCTAPFSLPDIEGAKATL